MDRLDRLVRTLFLAFLAALGALQIPLIDRPPLIIADFVFVALACFWFSSIVSGRHKIRWHNFYYLLIAYLAALSVSTAFSMNTNVSSFRLLGEVYLVAICVVTFDVGANLTPISLSFRWWLVGAAISVTVGIATVFIFYVSPSHWVLESTTYHYGAVPVGNFPRITATFPSASMFCNYLNASLVIALAAGVLGSFNKYAGGLIIAGILICSLFTFSIGLGGIFLALGVWFWWVARGRRQSRSLLYAGMIIAAAFLALSLLALVPYAGGQVIGTLPFVDIPLMPSSRVLVWSDAIRTFAYNLITGQGLGTPVANVVFTNTDGSLSLLTDAHNVFLNVAAQNGIPGLTAIVLIAVFVVRKWARMLGDRESLPGVAIGLALICSLIYQGLTGSFEEARHIWALLGLFLAADLRNGTKN